MDQIGLPLARGVERAVSVSFPRGGAERGPYRSIRRRGNVPLLIGDCLLAELKQQDLVESWQSATAMSDDDAARYCRMAANRLARAFDSGIAAADLPDLVGSAVVLFLLSLKGAGVRSPDRIYPCTITYDGSATTGAVLPA